MKQGKRYIRNTVFALYGVTVLAAATAWLHASVVDAGTPPWLRSAMALGLEVAVEDAGPASEAQPVQVMSVKGLRDRTELVAEGDFAVEVMGARQNRISMTRTGGSSGKSKISVGMPKSGPVRVKGDPGLEGAVLRIETATLHSIDTQGAGRLTVSGVRMPTLSIRMNGATAVRLQDNAVGRWVLHSDTPVEVLVDKATASAGFDAEVSGAITIRHEKEVR